MPSQLSDLVLTIIRNVLVDNWDPTQAAGYNPRLAQDDPNFLLIHTGSYGYHPRDPQIALPTFEESVLGGGATGYTGMRGDGTGLNQDRDGTVFIECWAEGETSYNGEHPQDLVDLLAKEASRILQNHATGTTDASGDPELRYLSPETRFPNDDTDADPVVRGQQVTCGYGWLNEP